MTDNYDLLINKLDEFIRKYYKNMLVRGGLYFLAIFIAFFVFLNILEFFAYFGTIVRTILFYLFLVVNAFIFVNYILIPLFKIYRLGKIISYEKTDIYFKVYHFFAWTSYFYNRRLYNEK